MSISGENEKHTLPPHALISSEHAQDRHMGVKEAASFLGISISELTRRQKQGLYRVAFTTDTGRRKFSLADLTALRNLRSTSAIRAAVMPPPPPEHETRPIASRSAMPFTPDEAARVFEELDKGAKPAELVKQLKIHPYVVKSIHLAWMDLSRGMWLDDDTLEAIYNLSLAGRWPIRGAADLLKNLREIAEACQPCPKCKKRPRHMCLTCAASAISSQRADDL